MEAKDVTAVICRQWPEGDVVAIFPTLEEGNYRVMMYQHIGQHGGGDMQGVIARTKLASEADYLPLKEELERIGYTLKVYKRDNRKFQAERSRLRREDYLRRKEV